MNKLKQKARRARDRLFQRSGGANASTPALVSAVPQAPIETPRPLSAAAGPLPVGNTSLARPEALHHLVVPDPKVSTSSGPIPVVPVPQIVVLPCRDQSGAVSSTSASHGIQTISPPQILNTENKISEQTVPPQNSGVPSVLNDPITRHKVLFSCV